MKKILIIILFPILFTACGYFSTGEENKMAVSTATKNSQENVTTPPLKLVNVDEYKIGLLSILQSSVSLTEKKEQLTKIAVPKEFLDFHFKLFLAIGSSDTPADTKVLKELALAQPWVLEGIQSFIQ